MTTLRLFESDNYSKHLSENGINRFTLLLHYCPKGKKHFLLLNVSNCSEDVWTLFNCMAKKNTQYSTVKYPCVEHLTY
jgi:hypothetical protein